MENYSIQFVERTKLLLERLEGKAHEEGLDVTFMLNTLLGLIVLCSEEGEDVFTKNIDDEFIERVIPPNIKIVESTEISFTEDLDKVHEVKISKRKFLKSKKQYWYIKNLRNGIAHQNIITDSDGSRYWSHITIQNKKKGKTGKINFEVRLSITELKNLANTIADQYLAFKKRKSKK